MDKNEMLRDYYISQITRLIEICEDISLLDFVFRLLKKSIDKKTSNNK